MPSPSGFIGVQQSFESRLLYRLQQLKINKWRNSTVQVKLLTGDGTYIAKCIHVLNFAFTLLNEGSAALSVFDNHLLLSFKCLNIMIVWFKHYQILLMKQVSFSRLRSMEIPTLLSIFLEET